MTLFKRNIGRRVAGVGIGVALLMLGLEAPAFAAAPVVSSFTPTSGPATGGCVVVVTGTALDDFAAATCTFENATAVPPSVGATDFVLVSDTEAWVTAPALTGGTAYNIKVSNLGGTSTSTGTFLATTGAGNCAPTITSFAPACGSTNDKVVVTGTNLLLDGVAANDTAGGTVQFKNTLGTYTTVAAVVPPDSDTATQLTRFVSSDAADGPIKVTAGGGEVFSTASFLVPPPDCVPVGPVTHARSISLSLRKHLVARGKVSVGDAFTDCAASVPVKIQRRVSGHWKTVGSTTTSDTGAYKKRIRDKAGKYRAKAPKVSLGTPVTDICSGATSPVRRVS